MDSGMFQAIESHGQQWVGRKLLIASGKEHIFSSIPGYSENFTTGM